MIEINGNTVSINGHNVEIDVVNSCLSEYVTESRRAIIEQVISNRCKSIVPVLENIYDRGNISAVMRSAEAHGYFNLNIIEKPDSKFKNSNRVSQGTEKWLNIKKFSTATECAKDLKAKGFQIISTHLDAAKPIGEIDFSKPTALVLGNERDGVSPEMLELSDANVIIPMRGFAQSFNISVAGAISFYHIYQDRLAHGLSGDLSKDEKKLMLMEYYLKGVKRPEDILKRRLN